MAWHLKENTVPESSKMLLCRQLPVYVYWQPVAMQLVCKMGRTESAVGKKHASSSKTHVLMSIPHGNRAKQRTSLPNGYFCGKPFLTPEASSSTNYRCNSSLLTIRCLATCRHRSNLQMAFLDAIILKGRITRTTLSLLCLY